MATTTCMSASKPSNYKNKRKTEPLVDTQVNESIQRLMATYQKEYTALKDEQELELEARICNVDENIFKTVYKNARTDPKITMLEHTDDSPLRSLAIVFNDPNHNDQRTTFRRMKEYNSEGVRIRDMFVRKSNVINRPLYIQGLLQYKLSLSREQPTNAFVTPLNSHVRYRLRQSCLHEDVPDWRIDFTVVYTTQLLEHSKYLESTRDRIFTPAYTSENFLSQIPVETMNKWEIELEWIGGETTPDKAKIDDIIAIIFPLFGEQCVTNLKIQNEIYQTANDIGISSSVIPMFRKKWGMKRLMPQVTGLSLQLYRQIYPPYGMCVSEKYDGYRCIVRLTLSHMTLIYKNTIREIPRREDAVAISGGDHLPVDISIPTSASIMSSSHANAISSSNAIGNKSQKDSSPMNGHTSMIEEKRAVCVFDAEFIPNRVDFSESQLRIFDVMTLDGNPTHALIGKRRIDLLDTAAERCQQYHLNTQPVRFYPITEENIDTVFHTAYTESGVESHEGLIIMSGISSYLQTKRYKWKEPSHNTIDFLVMKPPVNVVGNHPFEKRDGYTLYILFNGVNKEMKKYLGLKPLKFQSQIITSPKQANYVPVPFTPSSSPLAYIYYHPNDGDSKSTTSTGKSSSSSSGSEGDDGESSIDSNDIHGKIVELKMRQGTDLTGSLVNWEFVKLRKDRKLTSTYFGNDFYVAEVTFQNYITPFKFEYLSEVPNSMKEMGSSTYDSIEKVKHFMSSYLLMKYAQDAKWVLDIGQSHNVDLAKYQVMNVRNLIIYYEDSSVINNAVLTKYHIYQHNDGVKMLAGDFHTGKVSMQLHTMPKPKGKIHHSDIKELCKVGLDITMLCYSLGQLNATTATILNELLTINTKFIILLIIDSDRVDKLIADKHPFIERVSKTKIQTKIDHVNLDPETVVPINTILQKLGNKYTLKNDITFDTPRVEALFKTTNPYIYDSLTTEDIEYLSIFRGLVFQKNSRVK